MAKERLHLLTIRATTADEMIKKPTPIIKNYILHPELVPYNETIIMKRGAILAERYVNGSAASKLFFTMDLWRKGVKL